MKRLGVGLAFQIELRCSIVDRCIPFPSLFVHQAPTMIPGTTREPTKLPTQAPTTRQYNYTVLQSGKQCQDSFLAW